jgi:hypothetical protein
MLQMKNTIISYANLSKELKAAFRQWLQLKTPDLISFPFKGQHMKGYIFNHMDNNYLIIMQLAGMESLDDSIDNIDVNEEF